MQYARDMKAKAHSNLKANATPAAEVINGILANVYAEVLENVDLRARKITLDPEARMYAYAVRQELCEAGYKVEHINPLEFSIKW